MRSRPITEAELWPILRGVASVCHDNPKPWFRFILGLWFSGLRCDELRRLSWEPSADLYLDDSQSYPLIRMLAGGHKSRRDEWQPVTPEFWRLANRGIRSGPVFPLADPQPRADSIVKRIAAIGAASGVVTDPTTGKTATSHDIGRRAFLSRMDGRLTLAELQKWARHASPETTATYYHYRAALDLSARVWGDEKVAN